VDVRARLDVDVVKILASGRKVMVLVDGDVAVDDVAVASMRGRTKNVAMRVAVVVMMPASAC
jgi:hypothetical protein